jgi:dolichol-phosphate mannosyltransferase
MEHGSPRAMIIVPTYDELENIKRLVPILIELGPEIEVLVVDDNSPDGTGAWVEQFSRSEKRVHCIRRPGKMGLGSAYIDGFRYALARNVELIFEMDADFSHDPNDIPRFFDAAKTADLVLGSRYLNGVTVVNWPLSRLMLSYTANVMSRVLTGLCVKDATGGYKCFHRRVLESIDLDKIHSDGYSFQIEVSFLAWRAGFVIREIPIIFVDRRAGISKMNRRIIYEAVFVLWRLFFIRLFGRRTRRATFETRSKSGVARG